MKTNETPKARKSPLRVLVADDTLATSEDLSSMLSREAGIQVVSSATKAIEALSLIDSEQPDVVLLNIKITGRSLWSMLNLIKRATPVPTVLVLTSAPSEPWRDRCLNSGADYVFPKPIDFKCVVSLLKKLASAKKSSARKRS